MLTAGTLTVKHIEKSGHQGIVQAVSVTFKPGDKDTETQVIAHGVPLPVNDGCNIYKDGTVYVMNEAGATVSRYELD